MLIERAVMLAAFVGILVVYMVARLVASYLTYASEHLEKEQVERRRSLHLAVTAVAVLTILYFAWAMYESGERFMEAIRSTH